MRKKKTTLRLIELNDEHLSLLIKWLDAQHVKPWFTHPDSWLEEARERKGAYDWIQHYIITVDDAPIGFCQYYPYWKSGEDWHGSIPPEGVYSIDYLIGEAEYLRKGYAGTAIRLLIDQVKDRPDAVSIIVQPDEDNYKSQKTLLSVGFKYDEENKLFLKAIG